MLREEVQLSVNVVWFVVYIYDDSIVLARNRSIKESVLIIILDSSSMVKEM